MKRIRGGSGLGDSLYVRGVVVHLLKQDLKLEVCTKYPQVFDGLNVKTSEFSRHNISILAHYSLRREERTNQWEDVRMQAGIKEDIPFNLEWKRSQSFLSEHVRDLTDKPIFLIGTPRIPMDRSDGFGRELLPDEKSFRHVCESLDGFKILVGGKPKYYVDHDLDLSESTSVQELLDLAQISSGGIGQCSFMVPLMEGMGRPLLAIWGSKIHQAPQPHARRLLPNKVLSSKKSTYIFDSWNREEIEKEIVSFCRLAKSSRANSGQKDSDCWIGAEL